MALQSVGVVVGITLLCGLHTSAQALPYTDSFSAKSLHHSWNFRAENGGTYEFRDGWIHIVAPGRGFVNPHSNQDAPMLLIDPPANTDTFSFETRLKFLRTTAACGAGLVAIRKDLTGSMVLNYQRERAGGVGVLQLYFWDHLHWEPGGVLALFAETEDIWLRVEMGLDLQFFFWKDVEGQPWTPASAPNGNDFVLPATIDPRFEPGTYWIGLFVMSGQAADEEVEVAFDYFNSPELGPLPVTSSGSSALVWAAIKAP